VNQLLRQLDAEIDGNSLQLPDDEDLARTQARLELRDYLTRIRKHLRLVILCCLLSAGLAGLFVFTRTPVYTATATLMIERNRPQVLQFRGVDAADSAIEDDRYDYYKTQYELLRNYELVRQVIDQLALTHVLLPPRDDNGPVNRWWTRLTQYMASAQVDGAGAERGGALTIGGASRLRTKLVEAYLGRLKIQPVGGTRLVKVSFSLPNPLLAAAVANTHAHAFIMRNLQLNSGTSEEARHFLETKLIELKARLTRSEVALNSYHRDKKLLSPNGREDVVIDRLDALNRAATDAEVARVGLEAEEQLIRKGDDEALPEVTSSEVVRRLKEQVAELAANYAGMQSNYYPGYPPLDQLAAEEREAQARLSHEIGKIAQAVAASYQGAVDRQNRLDSELAHQRALALAEKDDAVQYAILAREVDANRQLYESVLGRMKEVEVAADVRSSNIYLVENAHPPLHPSWPRKPETLTVAAMLGLLGGIGAALFLETMQATFRDSEEASYRLGLPSLAVVPDFGRLKGFAPRLALGIGAMPSRRPRMNYETFVRLRQTPVSEIYRHMRNMIMLSRAGQAPKVVMFTSALDAEGKTVTATNTALAFAHTGARVLLIDADLRRPSCHTMLGLEKGIGLAEVLAGQSNASEAIVPTQFPDLWLLQAGVQPPNPAELVGSQQMGEILARLSDDYDFILIDTPPLLLVSDALPLGRMADGVVLVISGPTTSRQAAAEASYRLRYAGAKVLGVVFNKADTPGANFYHGRYYYAYGAPRPFEGRENTRDNPHAAAHTP
jgi:succinoglycan biosynthesis transport protein ExoP